MLFPELASIKSRRLKLGINQKELASLAGISQSFVTKLEKGKLEPSYSIAKNIFSALDSVEHKKEKKCSDIMTKKVIFLRKNDRIEKASELMKKNSISQIPVIEGKLVIGSISESIIFSRMLAGISKKQLFDMPVEKIMTEHFPIVHSGMPASIVLPMLKSSEAILVTENKKLVGIITKANLI